MSRYIKADKEYLEPFFYEHLTDYEMIAAQNAIDEVPTADVESVRHGKWLRNACMDDIYYSHYKCSECEREIEIPHSDTEKLTIKYPYCHCGAKMDGE